MVLNEFIGTKWEGACWLGPGGTLLRMEFVSKANKLINTIGMWIGATIQVFLGDGDGDGDRSNW